MRNSLLLISIIVSVSCGSVSNPGDAINQLQRGRNVQIEQIDSIAQTISKFPNQTQLAIALIHDSTTTFYGALRKNDTLKTHDNRRKVFEIGSLSKVFTSALLADLVSKGKVYLDQPIQDFLDFQLKDSVQITFKELANHTSGLPRIPSGFIWQSLWHLDNPYRDYDEVKLRDYLINDVEVEEGQKGTFQYSNIGAGLLGYVMTIVTGQSYEQMLQHKIFGPFHMSNSTTSRSTVSDKLVKGIDKRGNVTSNWDLGALPAAGAILSTTEDLSKFAIANFDSTNKVLTLQHQKTYTIGKNRDMALGWFIIKKDSINNWLWHNGGTGGYRSSMVLDIEQKKGVIILSNISTSHKYAHQIDDLSYFLLESLN